MYSDAAIEKLDTNTICYVYPSGEIVVAEKLTAQERELRNELSQFKHMYSTFQKLNRYKHKFHQPLGYAPSQPAA